MAEFVEHFRRSEKHIDNCNVGAGVWLLPNFELGKDCGFVNYQTRIERALMRQPAKVTQMTSMMETLMDRKRSA